MPETESILAPLPTLELPKFDVPGSIPGLGKLPNFAGLFGTLPDVEVPNVDSDVPEVRGLLGNILGNFLPTGTTAAARMSDLSLDSAGTDLPDRVGALPNSSVLGDVLGSLPKVKLPKLGDDLPGRLSSIFRDNVVNPVGVRRISLRPIKRSSRTTTKSRRSSRSRHSGSRSTTRPQTTINLPTTHRRHRFIGPSSGPLAGALGHGRNEVQTRPTTLHKAVRPSTRLRREAPDTG